MVGFGKILREIQRKFYESPEEEPFRLVGKGMGTELALEEPCLDGIQSCQQTNQQNT